MPEHLKSIVVRIRGRMKIVLASAMDGNRFRRKVPLLGTKQETSRGRFPSPSPASAGSLLQLRDYRFGAVGTNNARIFGDETIRPMKERGRRLPRGHSDTPRVNSEVNSVARCFARLFKTCARTRAAFHTRRQCSRGRSYNPLQHFTK